MTARWTGMYMFTFLARPNPDNAEYEKAGGAYVNCYIDFREPTGARLLAEHYIRQEKWNPEKLDGEYEASTPKDEEEGQWLSEAREYGFCLVFHMWPVDAPDTTDESIDYGD
jgi:hypothetical protein